MNSYQKMLFANIIKKLEQVYLDLKHTLFESWNNYIGTY